MNGEVDYGWLSGLCLQSGDPKRKWAALPFAVGDYICATDGVVLAAIAGGTGFALSQLPAALSKQIPQWFDCPCKPTGKLELSTLRGVVCPSCSGTKRQPCPNCHGGHRECVCDCGDQHLRHCECDKQRTIPCACSERLEGWKFWRQGLDGRLIRRAIEVFPDGEYQVGLFGEGVYGKEHMLRIKSQTHIAIVARLRDVPDNSTTIISGKKRKIREAKP